jgi:hypothetical protein
MKTVFEVEIKNIEVDEFYFSFNYKIKRDNELVAEDSFEDDHSWEDKKAFKKLLKERYAVDLALERALDK